MSHYFVGKPATKWLQWNCSPGQSTELKVLIRGHTMKPGVPKEFEAGLADTLMESYPVNVVEVSPPNPPKKKKKKKKKSWTSDSSE